jgi:hypothetical protein
MRLSIVLMRTLLNIPYGFRRLTRTGAFGKSGAICLESPPLRHANPLKAALWHHHIKQYNASSCSVATVTSVLNAIRTVHGRPGPPIDPLDVLDRVTIANWKARLSRGGHHGRRGLPLPLLGSVVEGVLAAYGAEVLSVETVQATRQKTASLRIRKTLRRRLAEFDARGNGVVIAHFDQGAYVPELNIPHISPVGAFDAATGAVTVLDVDPDQDRPYRVSFETFYRGLASDYHRVFQPFGYLSGGYVYIRLKSEG